MSVKVSRGGSLTIRRVVSKDGGVYRCIAANTVGKIASVAEVRIIGKNFFLSLSIS